MEHVLGIRWMELNGFQVREVFEQFLAPAGRHVCSNEGNITIKPQRGDMCIMAVDFSKCLS